VFNSDVIEYNGEQNYVTLGVRMCCVMLWHRLLLADF